MRFGNFLLTHRIFFFFSLWFRQFFFPKVIILIMFMEGAKLAQGGGEPPKIYHASRENATTLRTVVNALRAM